MNPIPNVNPHSSWSSALCNLMINAINTVAGNAAVYDSALKSFVIGNGG